MPITPTEQSCAVADKLSINGWKDDWHDGPYNETHRCLTCHRWNIPTHAHFSQPPPDLASPAGADVLMTALWKRDIHIGIARSYVQLVPLGGGFHVEGLIINGNIRLALLDAAWRLLCEGK